MKIRTSLVHLTGALLDLRWNGAERISKCGWSIRTGSQCESRRGQPSEMLCAVARRVSGLPKLHRVPPFAYDLTGLLVRAPQTGARALIPAYSISKAAAPLPVTIAARSFGLTGPLREPSSTEW
jgi:hypothetical protein